MIFKDIKILDKDFLTAEHQNVVVSGKFITYVGTELHHESGHEIIDGKNRFLMPAFFNTHCHVPMTLLRGYGEGLPLNRWLNEKVFPFEAKFTGREKYAGAALGACELIKSGCVSISDAYSELADYAGALYEAGMKANLCNQYLAFDENASFYKDRSYRDSEALKEWIACHDTDRIKLDAGIHSEYCTNNCSLSTLKGSAADYYACDSHDLISRTS